MASKPRAIDAVTGKAREHSASSGADKPTRPLARERGIKVVEARAVDQAASSAATGAVDKQRKMRSLAIALALAGLVILFYVATIVRLGGNVFNRPL